MTREVLCDMARGDNITLSTLRATVHLGSHADAPSHYQRDGETIERQALDVYIGACHVVEARIGRGQRVSMGHLVSPPRWTHPRVLIRTGTYPDSNRFTTDFAALDPALVETLGSEGVRLVGIDTPSVDLFESKDLPAHQAFARANMRILEGLVLGGVAAGEYELIALPLRLVGFDASPVRAVLRTLR